MIQPNNINNNKNNTWTRLFVEKVSSYPPLVAFCFLGSSGFSAGVMFELLLGQAKPLPVELL
ncbi:hypothetical protein I7I53_00045 [Histoplasma capsulatum var. duboisii H88]|nr:hypothetical protein I7I53_00045 [Histoplasma capsulatum var. duboisii H88]